jgi:hypothetical protein
MDDSQRAKCTTDPVGDGCETYNVLSLESANYKAYMTSEFISFLEQIAYYSARDNYCIPEREAERIAMPELFDLISGSETGAIIAASLNRPNDDKTPDGHGNVQINKWWASKTSELFYDNSKNLYEDNHLSTITQIIIIIAAVLIDSGLVYLCLRCKYKPPPGYEDKIDKL